MRVLLSDGSGATSRQIAQLLGQAGHEVDVLAPEGVRARLRPAPDVGRVFPVPGYAAEPWAWFDAAEKVVHAEGHDVVLPLGGHVAVFARAESLKGSSAGSSAVSGRVAVPRFPALERVFDKVSAAVTLTELGLPQPESLVVRSAEALRQIADPPLYLKRPVGGRVARIRLREELLRLADGWDAEGVFEGEGRALVRHPAHGPLITAQSVFDNGRLVAAHAYEHIGRGGAAKRSLASLAVREHITLLGAHIGWHGALSMDGILTADGPMWIDVNPCLTDPTNAALSGVDLVGSLLAVSVGQAPASVRAAESHVLTHQFVGGLGEASAEGRLAVLKELWQAAVRSGRYRGSAEELLSVRREPRAIPGLLGWALGALATPGWSTRRAERLRSAESCTAETWRVIGAGPPSHG